MFSGYRFATSAINLPLLEIQYGGGLKHWQADLDVFVAEVRLLTLPPEPAGKMPAPRSASFQRAGGQGLPSPAFLRVSRNGYALVALHWNSGQAHERGLSQAAGDENRPAAL
jgi:hypothetical protein